MNIHAISQRSHWSTQIYAVRCRPTPDDTSKCRSNRTKFNINDSDAASTHDVVRYVNSVEQTMCSITESSPDVVCRRTTSDDVVRCVNGP